MRLAVYTDYTYRRVDGRVYAERAFALSAPRQAVPAMARSLTAFWRLLGDVDGAWLLGPHPLALAFAALALVRRKRVVLGTRQDFPRYVRARHPGRRWMYPAADALEAAWRTLARFTSVIAVGPSLAAAYPRAPTLEIGVSLVRANEIAPDEVAAARSYDDTPELRVLSVGRLEEEKNPLLLADVAAGLRERDLRWRLIVCGEGPMEDDLRRRVAELGVADAVELRGYVEHDELRRNYRSSHALLHVSWTEGLPQVLFEAFAARLPVVATAVGGVPSAAGGAVLLIEPGDAAAAVQALERVRTEAPLRAALIEAGVATVSARTLDAEARKVAAFLSR